MTGKDRSQKSRSYQPNTKKLKEEVAIPTPPERLAVASAHQVEVIEE
ncbi:MAG: hypothetical protein V6Z81_08130 [Parvularculales bacterium]